MLPNDAIEYAFMVFGLLMGVLFILDGWRGSSKVTDLRNAPRVRALVWATGGAIGTFALDLKRIGLNLPEDRSRLFAVYIEGFALAAFAVFMLSLLYFWGQSAFTAIFRRSNFPTGADTPSIPILDYVFYGYGCFRESRDKELTASRSAEAAKCREFLAAYAGELASSVSLVNYLKEHHGEADPVARAILGSLARLLERSLRIKINANYMHAYEARSCPPEIIRRVRFASGNQDRYSHFLALTSYAYESEKETFVLPVEAADHPEADNRLLPGAPVAFSSKKMVYIEDTGAIEFPNGIDESTRNSQRQYFRAKKFKSFLSIPILGVDGEPVGVLNVDANQKSAFGQSEDEIEAISTTVLPFCALLSAIIVSEVKE
jgi:hypothetical protein